jgi:hypothetical protein
LKNSIFSVSFKGFQISTQSLVCISSILLAFSEIILTSSGETLTPNLSATKSSKNACSDFGLNTPSSFNELILSVIVLKTCLFLDVGVNMLLAQSVRAFCCLDIIAFSNSVLINFHNCSLVKLVKNTLLSLEDISYNFFISTSHLRAEFFNLSTRFLGMQNVDIFN